MIPIDSFIRPQMLILVLVGVFMFTFREQIKSRIGGSEEEVKDEWNTKRLP